MIELVDVKKGFEGSVLFENLNLKIEDGEFVVFSGPSGSGKTTLLNLIGGLEKPDEGRILIDGKDMKKSGNKMEAYRSRIGFLFQNFALVDNKTVRENLEFIYSKSRSDMSFEEALEIVDLKDKMNTKVYKLSGGEQQRIAVARLLIKKCDIILADEPTGSLDEGNADVVMELLKKLHEMGKTIVVVTHNEKQKKMASRVVDVMSLRVK